MLVFGRNQFANHFRWFLLTLILTAAAVVWYVSERTPTDNWPGGSSRVGLVLGVVGAAIIGFEMLLWPRKRFPWARTLPLGRTQTWLKAHIWLGLLCVPVAVLHAGFRFGGTLTTTLMLVFFAVIASGIWGLILQHLLPKLLLERVPDEVPAAEIQRVLPMHTQEFGKKLSADLGMLGLPAVPGADAVRDFFLVEAYPYLMGQIRSATLASPDRAEQRFEALRKFAPEAEQRVNELEELCTLRRQLDGQARLQWWLHSWIWFHLPASVILVGLLVVHIYTALRYI